jgi:CBS domain-containing protein
MNILFFLSPKQDLMYVYDDFTLRQTLEKWEHNRYASIPVLTRSGEYAGTLTEGDILWGIKNLHSLDMEAAEDIPIRTFPHKRDYTAVRVTTTMEELLEAAASQNFVPVVDDRNIFIGIVRRQAIIQYLMHHAAPQALPSGTAAKPEHKFRVPAREQN